MLNYKKVDILGFEYEIEDLVGYATLFICANPFDQNKLFKYIDIEHEIEGGGYFLLKDAKRSFKEKLKELFL